MRRPSLDFAATHPLRPLALAGILSLVSYASAVDLCYVVLEPWVEARRLVPIMRFTLAFLSVWAVLVAVMLYRRPSSEEAVRIWSPAARFIVLASQIPPVWMIWGIMRDLPAGAELSKATIVTLIVAMVPVQIICSPENTAYVRTGIITVLGSTVAMLAMEDDREERLLALYVFGFACLLFWVCDTVRRTVERTVDARVASEVAAQSLQRMLTEVAAERDAKTRFMSSASHDLGQPLQAASLFFEQALRARDVDTRAKAEDGARRAFAGAEQLLGHMLSHLRLEADAVRPYPSPLLLETTLARISAQYGPTAETAGLKLRPLTSRQILMADPALLERALGNLIDNAIRHSGGSGLLIFARRHGASALRLWVIDDGVGIGAADAKHVFDDYYQGTASSAKAKGGFGLGLSSVSRLMTLMGGNAGIDPRWIHGTAFYLHFDDAIALEGPSAPGSSRTDGRA